MVRMSRNETPHPSCVGICKQYLAKKPFAGGRYEYGQKRCQMCLKFILWEGLWCPCCGYRLRTKTRIGRLKEKFRASVRIS